MGLVRKVLIVEDESSFIELIRENLECLGIGVHPVSSLSEAFSAVRKYDFDFVLLDGSISEPEDGLKFFAQNYTKIPVIGISANREMNLALQKKGAVGGYEKTKYQELVKFLTVES